MENYIKDLARYLDDSLIDDLNVAADKMYHQRIPLQVASPSVYDAIYDVVMDYAEDNSLGDEWCDTIDIEETALDIIDYLDR